MNFTSTGNRTQISCTAGRHANRYTTEADEHHNQLTGYEHKEEFLTVTCVSKTTQYFMPLELQILVIHIFYTLYIILVRNQIIIMRGKKG